SRNIMSWLVILGLLIVMFMVLNSSKRGQEVTWDEFQVHLQSGHIKDNAVLVLDDRITAEIEPGKAQLPDGTTVYVRIDAANRDFWVEKLDAMQGVKYRVNTGTSIWIQLLMSFAPIILIIAIIWFFIA